MAPTNSTDQLPGRWCWCVIEPDPLVARRTLATLRQRCSIGGLADQAVFVLTSWPAAGELADDDTIDADSEVIGTAAADSFASLTGAVAVARRRDFDAVVIVPGDVLVDFEPSVLSELAASIGDDLIIVGPDASTSAFADPAISDRATEPPIQAAMVIGCGKPLEIDQRLVGPGGWSAVARAVADRGGVVRHAPEIRSVDLAPGDAELVAWSWDRQLRNELIHGEAPTLVLEPQIDARVRSELALEVASPWWWFDSIVCINRTGDHRRRRLTQTRCDVQGFGDRLTWFPAVESPYRIPEAILLSHRTVIEDAARRSVERLLILEDDVVFADDVNERFAQIIASLGDSWHLGYLGGIAALDDAAIASASANGVIVDAPIGVYTTHGYAVNRRAFAHLLGELPTSFDGAAAFIAEHGPIDNWYASQVESGTLTAWLAHPQIAVQADQLSRRRADLRPGERQRFRS